MGSGLLCKQCKLATDFQSTALSMLLYASLYLKLVLYLYLEQLLLSHIMKSSAPGSHFCSQLRIMVLIMA